MSSSSANYKDTFKTSFIMDENALNSVFDLLKRFFKEISIETECADQISRKYRSVSDLVKFNNSNLQKITEISFSAHTEDYDASALISFGSSLFSGVYISIDAPEPEIVQIRHEFINILDGLKPWYNFITRFEFGSFFTGVIGGILTIPYTESFYTGVAFKISLPFQLYKFVVLAAPFVLFLVFKNKVFPRSVFLVGQQKSNFLLLQNIQWAVIGGFLISILASVYMSFLVPQNQNTETTIKNNFKKEKSNGRDEAVQMLSPSRSAKEKPSVSDSK